MQTKKPRPRVKRKWPKLDNLKCDKFFEEPIEHHLALRTAATRAGRRLKRTFSVRKFPLASGGFIIRVYRTK